MQVILNLPLVEEGRFTDTHGHLVIMGSVFIEYPGY